MNPTNIGNIEAVLSQIRNYQAQAQDGVNTNPFDQNQGVEKAGFADAVKGAIQEVNGTQMRSKELKTAYEMGEDVPLTDVVIGMQKSSLAFEATLQIRNKVLKAYEDILHMPV
ncbi:MAG TPA: flagellar hook-basal body complex protein FliE [Porticoccaceae bacterium]|jgi:flagellar hook-basal body complex protein FliE|nr:flagellar hook-basal body complex protein FliE [Porticoccaceae bacterium]|tara:strand:+ start:352 stop:690 length:339 start_codon:yes stop_codon:yes gene_type:complete